MTQPHDKNNEALIDKVKEGKVDSLESSARYLAYGARLRTALVASSRYLAYTSDVGEAFRPIVPPAIVTAAYGISWLYLGLDVGYEGYKSAHAGQDKGVVATTVVKRGLFQSLASMAFPMLTIHSIVKYSAYGFKNVKNPKVKAWGPTLLGLGIVPFLPYIFDEPIEHIVDKIFKPIEERVSPNPVSRLGHNKLGDDLPTEQQILAKEQLDKKNQ
ncbi:mitochondrial 18 KDa protein-domain-containing protein [Cokeromyces recurvatus]|uniref:mitochondrial 18 KDa protein-domain-containing protein n=1 Tax=Cokeromyces recurvatus TaxID=90255 RepID=UPI002220E7E0|nr:mitochondrial 18 KDa protein-domain-containing protein [Cokeromyces recurvatus]KAI7905863.1 mitochondrial 18 KDa protein-domain-containing protein [Cokeromyces recurvatus]